MNQYFDKLLEKLKITGRTLRDRHFWRAVRRNVYLLAIVQFVVIILIMEALRIVFAVYNADIVGEYGWRTMMKLCAGGLPFDLCVAAYFNLPFLLMRMMPFDFVTRKWYLRTSNILFGIGNTLMLILAIGDIPYFQFSGSRLRWHGLTDLLTDNTMGGVVMSYLSEYWWAFLLGICLIASVWGLAFALKVDPRSMPFVKKVWRRCARAVMFLIMAACTFLCLRGKLESGNSLSLADGFSSLDDVRQYNIIINTPFCVVKTISDNGKVPVFDFYTEEELGRIRSSLHSKPTELPDSIDLRGKNIMIIVLESGGAVWSENLALHKTLALEECQPFINSLAEKSLVVRHCMASGVRSIEGLTSIFGGFPTYGTMYYLSSPYSTNTLDSHPKLMREMGYDTKFYYGGHRGAFTIDAMLGISGFKTVTSREGLKGTVDYAEVWGVYDHCMAEYAAKDIANLQEPFYAGWFTLNPHGPFHVPEEVFTPPHNDEVMWRAVEYADYSVKRFFEEASKQPWFENTVFVITADHGCRDLRGTVYNTPYLRDHLVFMIYTPDGSVKPGVIEDRVMSQFDIGPTILDMAGYDKEYVALGQSLFDKSANGGFAVAFNNETYLVYGLHNALMMSADLQNVAEVYSVPDDAVLEHPLDKPYSSDVDTLAMKARAFMQDYSDRIRNNHLSLSSPAK